MDADLSERGRSAERLAHGALTDRLIKAFFEVHQELGGGFSETLYANAYEIALKGAGIAFERERAVSVRFRGQIVGVGRPDFIADGAVIVECKAVRQLDDWHRGQLLHYLRASGLTVGLLLNFGPRPTFARIVLGAKDGNDNGNRDRG